MTGSIARYAMASALALPLGACMQGDPASDTVVTAPQARVVGEAVSCVQTGLIASTQVHDDFTIDFEMRDGSIYRNTLPNRCPTLGFEERISYSVPTGRLCSGEIIRVIDNDGRAGASCGLGEFVPVDVADAR